MRVQDIQLLYDYNHWANQLLLAQCAKLDPAQYVAPTRFSYGSLRGTMVHILDVELSARLLWEGSATSIDLMQADFPTVASLQARWDSEEAALRAYLNGLHDADLDSVLRFRRDDGTLAQRVLWHSLVHILNHGTQHRSEAAVMLTDFGQSPGDIDFATFLPPA